MNELVSVILTTYNQKNTIIPSIDSVLNQTYHNIELIIVDNASTDGTFDMIAAQYNDDDRIIYIINDTTLDPSDARDIGIDAAHSNRVIFLTSGDIWQEDKLEKLLSQYAHRHIGIFVDDSQLSFRDGRTPEKGNPGIGGSEYELLLLIRYLAKPENETAVTVYHFNKHNILPEEVQSIIVDNKYQAIHQCESDRQDFLVFVFEYDLKWYEELAQHHVASVCWLTNYLKFYDPVFSDILLTSENIEKIVCVSQSMFSDYNLQKIQRKMCWIYNMWDAHHSIRRSSFPTEKNVTYIGGLYYQKGFHVLAKCWKKIVEAVPDAKLHVIGTGKLYSQSATLGAFGIADAQYECMFMPYLADNDGYLLPSVIFHGLMGIEKNEIIANTAVGVANPTGLTETFCISAVEFEAAGVPVVSKQTSGITDTVISGQTGILVNNEHELTDTIIKLLTDQTLNVTLGDAARSFVQNTFSPNFIIKDWLRLFDSL